MLDLLDKDFKLALLKNIQRTTEIHVSNDL